jgi:thiamine kinase-like enzyme
MKSGLTLPGDNLTQLVAKSVFGDKAVNLLRYGRINTPGSEVFRLEYRIDGAPRALYVKLPKNGGNSEQTKSKVQQLQREYSLSDNIKSAFESDCELQVVDPASFIKEINGFVTWEVCGSSLQDKISRNLLFRYSRESPSLTRLAQLSGKWLRRFHSLDLAADGIDFRRETLRYCVSRLEILRRNTRSHVSDDLAASLKQKILSWIDDALSGPDVKLILCHNDFSPHNIIVTDKGICILDFGYSTLGLPAFDLACFWHKLEDMKGSPVHGTRGLETMQHSFLQAYGCDFDTKRPDVKLGLLRLILSKMVTIMESGGLRRYSSISNRHRFRSYLSTLESDFDRP